ncbi:arogenate dehydrogenase 2, chloroplastic [Cryptomeria japonica]|uniref:arogenate dehydrogenase 2, chloroplastic n=1 Tax=Cryptomeria japonica TaxID=3369 RepID=UPI0027DAAFA4|nr:arogenate dehydrogenase 2, chloroplastic [Cryptomeria japonica]XP_057846215.2 arogenate dehydrogenase 2, chloroplastic [Cryptomeria japonica]XP_057846217.2 arogenate dehydrogenase 2, chloroplastic [Cryptomeria japonica]XP_057846218.2 arogenate dehydrogenase 2, chloroplastic [Cryptomeria japonica]
MAASVKISTVSFHSSQLCSGFRQPLMPTKIGYPKSVVLVSQKKKQNEKQSRFPSPLKVIALDAAQPFDYESKISNEIEKYSKLKIGIVGFGNFGQFLAKTIVRQGHTVLAHSRSDHSKVARKMGVSFYLDQDDFCEEHPEVILLCTSIISTESVLRSFPFQRLKRNTLFADVLSVKEFPRNLFLQVLPSEFDILCTHPMFGPESGKAGWSGLPLVYDKIKIGEGLRAERCERFLNIFAKEGCRMVEMSCAEHDRHAAETQFITHTVGRMLAKLNLESTPINTKGYESLLRIVENTCGDSFDLYYGLFMYNVNSTEQLERLEMAFDALKKQLVGRLHKILRTQLFDGVARGEVSEQNSTLADLKNSSPSDTAIPLRTK